MRRRGFSELFLVTRQETARKGASTNGLRCAPYAVYTLLCAAVYFQSTVKVRCEFLSVVSFHQGFVTLLSSSFHAGAELSVSRVMSTWLKIFIHSIHGAFRFQRLRTCQRRRIAWACQFYSCAQTAAVWPVRDCGATFLSTETKD